MLCNMKKEGILMPHHQFSDDDIITIKLDNGYNIGLAADKDTKITLLEKHKDSAKKSKEIPFDKNKPTVSVIGTGGTIACYVEYRTGAVHPASSAKELAFSVPELFLQLGFQLFYFSQLCYLLSSNLLEFLLIELKHLLKFYLLNH